MGKDLGAAAAGFLEWWAGELAGLIPASLLGRLRRAQPMLLLKFENDAIRAWRGAGRMALPLGSVGLDAEPGHVAVVLKQWNVLDLPTAVLLPPESALQKTLSLPLASEPHLASVLRYEVERYTPFTADRVRYAAELVARDRQRKTLELRLTVVPRERVEEAVMLAEARGFRPDIVAVDTGDYAALEGRNLMPRAPNGAMRLRQRLDIGLATLAAVLLIAAMLGPGLRYELRLDDLRTRIADARKLAEARAAGTGGAQASAGLVNEILRAKGMAPQATLLLEELSKVLPDNTWLNALSFSGKELAIEGTSAAAASLVPRIEASPRFGKVGFAAPTTLDNATRLERFRFTIQLSAGSP